MEIYHLFLISFGLNGFFFLFAALYETDFFTDITYSMTFIILTLVFSYNAYPLAPYQIVTALAVVLWGLRLGSFLLIRIAHIKVDHRFDERRSSVLKFASFWSLQALSAAIIMLPVYGILHASETSVPPLLFGLSLLIFAAGLIIESIADFQKFAFIKMKDKQKRWIDYGIWRYSRHPNYFGEILVWWGIALPGLVLFTGFEYLYFSGPLLITVLLLFVSGIPILEKSAEKKYGSNPEYRAYRDSTSILIPLPPRENR